MLTLLPRRCWLLRLGFASLASALAACGGLPSKPSAPPLAQDPWIQVYFNQSQNQIYTEPYRKKRRSGDDLEQVLVDAIDSAQTSVLVAVQELRLPRVAQALADRHRAGVMVQVVLENDYSQPFSQMGTGQIAGLEERDRQRYQEFIQLVDQNGDGQLSEAEIRQGDAIVILDEAGVPRLDDTADGSKGSGLMHHKFVVLDGQTVVTGSTNFTPSGTHGDFASPESRGNANHLLVLDSAELAQIFTQEFQILWGDGPGKTSNSRFGLQKPRRAPQKLTVGSTAVTVHFSPTSKGDGWPVSSNGLIGQTLEMAQRRVDLALFVFSDQPIVDRLQARHDQGVQVRALIDPAFAFRNYSEGLDMLGVALGDKNCKVEAGNRPWTNPIATMGVPDLPRGDKLHHKFAVIDSQRVITGSHNWSASANYQNDETLLILENSTVAAHFTREFDRLYGTAYLGLPKSTRSKLQEYQSRCL
ncbi:MAG: phospholipase D-like domain-containing protein [Prochlorothrix sp.]|nr:phospholipase D-like domain-containing protein [Prochlorothrix sp.]